MSSLGRALPSFVPRASTASTTASSSAPVHPMHPHNANGNDRRERRSRMPSAASTASSTAATYLPSTTLAMGLGMSMPMGASDLQQPQQPQPQPHPPPGASAPDASLVPFWRPGQQLELELTDIFSGREGGSAAATTGNGNGNPTTHATSTGPNHSSPNLDADVPMPTSIPDTSAYPMQPAYPTYSSVAPLHLHHPRGSAPMGSGVTSNLVTSLSPSPAQSSRALARPAVPVIAATGAPDATDFSRFADSPDAPDLTQHKIEQKNEKCQYHNCPNRARVLQAYGKFCNRHVIVAPCGFPGCRDKAMPTAPMCDKHQAEGNAALQRILANRAQNVPVCRTFGCFKNDQGRGYCRGHEKLLMATGRLPKHINKRRLNSAYTMCSYPDCNKHSQRNHLCRTHGNLIMKQAEEIAKQSTSETYEDVLARLQKEIRRCTHPTCTKNSQRDRLCTLHYYEKHNLQRDGTPKADGDGSGDGEAMSDDGGHTTQGSGGHDASSSASAMCGAAGCTAPVFARGFCKFHGSADKRAGSSDLVQDAESRVPPCAFTGCNNPAPYASGFCAHHGNKVNQAMQIARLGSTASSNTTSAMFTCAISSCGAPVAAGSNMCERHRRSLNGSADPGMRTSPLASGSMGDTNPAAFFPNAPGGQYLSSEANAAMSGMMERYSHAAAASSSSVSMGRMSSSSAETDARQALCTLNTSKQGSGGAYATGNVGNPASSSTSTCANPGCSRATSFGHEFCDACQNMFSPPLVVSIGDASGANYGFNMAPQSTSGAFQAETNTASAAWADSLSPQQQQQPHVCRVKHCGGAITRAGLCEAHFHAFQNGSISVDDIALPSRHKIEGDSTAHYPVNAASEPIADVPRALPAPTPTTSSPKVKKYFCKISGCEKQAQKRGFCKRHFRLQEEQQLATGDRTKDAAANASNASSSHHHRTAPRTCRFRGCMENAHDSSAYALCAAHIRATWCWQANCTRMVESPQFCDMHAASSHRSCAFQGCSAIPARGSSGCVMHVHARRCRHEHCDKFVASVNHDCCPQHLHDCAQQQCELCELYRVENESGKPSRLHASGGGVNTNDAMLDDDNFM